MTTLFALVFAAYLIVAGLRLLLDEGFYADVMHMMQESRGFDFFVGAMLLFIGGLFVSLHHHFETALAGVVTVFSAAIAIEGMLLILVPRQFLSIPKVLGLERAVRPWAVLAILLGIGLMAWALLA